MKKKIPNLIVERACDPGNAFFLSLLTYRSVDYLTVIDNITADEVVAYVLDYAQQEGMNVKVLVEVIDEWYHERSLEHPLSFEFSKLGLAAPTSRIYKTFELIHVTRLVGNDFRFPLQEEPKVRRRRISQVQQCVEVRPKAKILLLEPTVGQ